jgi:hypothetical protein
LPSLVAVRFEEVSSFSAVAGVVVAVFALTGSIVLQVKSKRLVQGLTVAAILGELKEEARV